MIQGLRKAESREQLAVNSWQERGEQSRQFQPPVVVGMKIIQDFQKQKAVYRTRKFALHFVEYCPMKI